ncbi:site-2 protease family protein [Picrophilus oshimae]|uniref:Membrane metalloprotease n=1 Tax=Picrophilus torridus (strain ATCC 700027 / DSM 9790 / JCM 10055 / NBRC 100828 / KAW 2/3) TaxID=1122961 RepID=Q6L0W1_PICTO|nr:site-2 protease family protein [Picrophilus oshimae]AAT43391.1 membrane metalloprotease [Picrophilus oshimae DSM 9789]
MNGYLIAALVVFAWIVIIIGLAPSIRKSKYFSLLGPALMVKSTKNFGIIDWISKHFPGKIFSRISVVIVILGAISALGMLLYESYLAFFIPPSRAPALNLYLAIPGINPYIPIGYGIFALVFAVVIHEMFHGIVARRHGIKVNSVGALFFIVPVGAFVEPDEDEVTKADPVIRRRIFAAGPGINIVIAVICIVLLIFVMMPASAPVHNGIYIEDSAVSSIPTGTEIIGINNYTGSMLCNIEYTSMIRPGTIVHAEIYNGKNVYNESIYAGVYIENLISGYPSEKAGVKPDSIIMSIDNKTIYNVNTLGNVLDHIRPGSLINMTVFYPASHITKTYTMRTVSTYSYYAKADPIQNSNAYKNQSFIGVEIGYSGLGYEPINYIHKLVFGGYLFGPGFFDEIGLPLLGLSPIPASMTHLFKSPFDPYIFFGIANVLYWLFWIDFLLGITNALPLSILDGGQFFKDSLTIGSRRFRFLKDEKNVNRIYYGASVLVFLILIWVIIAPRIF